MVDAAHADSLGDPDAQPASASSGELTFVIHREKIFHFRVLQVPGIQCPDFLGSSV